jgi:hypothetical protein
MPKNLRPWVEDPRLDRQQRKSLQLELIAAPAGPDDRFGYSYKAARMGPPSPAA